MIRPSLLLLALILAGAASAQTVEILRSSGPASNRIDLAIVGDGYTAAEQAKLTTDATSLVDALLNFPPYQQFSGLFNVTLIKAASNQDGADNGTAGGLRDTRYGAYFNCGGIDRLLCVNQAAVSADVQAYVPEANITIVVVNDVKYGGSGGSMVVASTNSASVDILRHELGHTLGHLADEYTSPYPGYPACSVAADCTEPNVTLRDTRATIKWSAWIDATTPIPTLASSGFGGVGLFAGARYLSSGIYRPVNTKCIMDALGNPFCPVCAEGLILSMSNYVEWIEGPVPAAGAVGLCASATDAGFDAPHPPSASFTFAYTWTVDGLPTAGPEKWSVSPATLGIGSHTVAVEVHVSTPLVRTDLNNQLRSQLTWTLDVQACGDGGAIVPDAGSADAGVDAGQGDAGIDAGPGDAGIDAGQGDAGTDAGTPASGSEDGGGGPGVTGQPDAGTAGLEPVIGGCGCHQGGGGAASGWLVFLVVALARRRSRGEGSDSHAQ